MTNYLYIDDGVNSRFGRITGGIAERVRDPVLDRIRFVSDNCHVAMDVLSLTCMQRTWHLTKGYRAIWHDQLSVCIYKPAYLVGQSSDLSRV